MSNDIDEMAKQFQSVEEMKIYSQAQQKTIINQSKIITKLENENSELKKQLADSVPKETSSIRNDLMMGTDPEIISKIQLKRLKEMSFDRELTLDEVKRVEILVKVLNADKKKDEKEESKSEPLSNDQLLKMLENFN